MMPASILLIDDDSFFARLTAAMLAPAQVVLAKDGAEGLALMKAQSFDLLITDLLMPGKDGIETILEIRRADAALPILAVSGGGKFGGRGDLLRMAQRLGANATLQKPFTREELLTAVETCLAAGSSPTPVEGSGAGD
ncbi:MAG: response regulator [Alphaproteobacteria bacterium]|nr:response regulator [Alphaproteobacteria bacterium]